MEAARSIRSLALALAVSILALPGVGTAATIAHEGFDYAVGELDGRDGGTGFAGAWTASTALTEVADPGTPLAFSGGGITVDGGASALRVTGNQDDLAFRGLAAPISADEVFVSFLFRYDGALQDNDFGVLWHDTGPGGSHTDRPNLGVKANQGDGSGAADVVARLQLSGSGQVYAVDVVAGETYFVLGRLHKSTSGAGSAFDRLDLWVNPAAGASGTPDATATGAGAIAGFDTIGVRTANVDAGDTFWLDELRYATSFADAVAGGSAVPEPSRAALLATGLLGLALARLGRRA